MVQLGNSYALSWGQSVTCTSLPPSQGALRSKGISSSQISKGKFEKVKHVLPESEETRKQRKPSTDDFQYTLFLIV